MVKNTSTIPLCRSRFLQDVTIALGRRSLKSLRQSNPSLKFDVSEDNLEGQAVERLDIEARTLGDRLTKIVLWEDGASWVFSRVQTRKFTSPSSLEVHANFATLNADQIAELVRMTLRDPVLAEEKWKELS